MPARKLQNKKEYILGIVCLGMPPSACRDLFSTECVLCLECVLYTKFVLYVEFVLYLECVLNIECAFYAK